MTNGEHLPGSRLRRFAERTLEPAAVERVVLPALADLQHECGLDGRVSRLVRLRAYWGLWKTLALCLLIESGTYGRPMVGGVVARMTVIIPIVMGIVLVPPVLNVTGGPVLLTPFLLTSLPQAFVFAVPIAFFFAVALDGQARSLRRLLPIVFAMSLVCSLAMLSVTLFVVPRANHTYAQSVQEHLKAAGRPSDVSFGPGEWTFTELVAKAQSAASERDRAIARRALGMRLATSTLPIVLGFLALGIAGYPLMHSMFNGLWVLMFYVAGLRAAAPSPFQGPSVRGIWIVNAVFALVGLWMVWVRPSAADSEPKGYVIS